ncbi:hypothetical protein FHX74_002554 [Friedmanniella endophytica]|uniref:Uncharacterized protein n=1 Tax=Microlunatus kandeliicorticis TaxID=1759536 RepID=A0A7W3P6D2_9ACTN|nr:hypothetical protein [Microlunatus kandeliicorticis]MBA8794926.1 hypothetical protein [Microlunatus kandeliicorticis]
MISAHAALGRTAGTGSHYASAEAALDQAQAHRGDLGSNYGYASQVQLGLVHAQLADPA